MRKRETSSASGNARPARAKARANRSTEAAAGRAGHTTAERATGPTPEERQQWIAVAAYYRAERRGFASGCEMDDWLAAEAEFEELAGTQRG